MTYLILLFSPMASFTSALLFIILLTNCANDFSTILLFNCDALLYPVTGKIIPDWEQFNTITGTWTYGDSDGNNGDFECNGGSDINIPLSCGLGCSTGNGKKFKVLGRCKGKGSFDFDVTMFGRFLLRMVRR